MDNSKTVKSPLDPLEKITLLKSYRPERLISEWKNFFNIDITSEFAGVNEINLYEGKSTGLQFFKPESIAGSGKLYEKLQKFDWFYETNKWEHQVALKDLDGCENVLEIGAGTGSFIHLAIEKGINIRGIEINDCAIEIANRNEISVDSIDLEMIVQDNRYKFDGVCCFQVLEHVANPKYFIETSLKLLKFGGILILSVPNADSYLKHQYNLLDMPPHHMTRWRKKTFKTLEKMFPVKIEKIRYEPLASYHVKQYVNAYYRFLKENFNLSRLLLNQKTLKLFKKLLSIKPIRNNITGHTLFVLIKKC